MYCFRKTVEDTERQYKLPEQSAQNFIIKKVKERKIVRRSTLSCWLLMLIGRCSPVFGMSHEDILNLIHVCHSEVTQ
ncbi:Uncharacterized protein HZ326_0722 [Fusarium oxysporum f. sp. albedinis]|nr:Uncharacterized protein HZ326_0722 [Fusarium oxysporum f. sp. albedinis]